MPRKPDLQLESRILHAAYRLWVEQGEHGMTMRSVAKLARTTTPTLYERFKDKNALMQALRERAKHKLFDAIEPAQSIGEICRRALEFTSTHGHEYELVSQAWPEQLSRGEPTPSFDLVKGRLAEQLGGTPDTHRGLALAIVMLCHGASTFLLQQSLNQQLSELLKQSCIAATDALVAHAQRASGRRAAD